MKYRIKILLKDPGKAMWMPGEMDLNGEDHVKSTMDNIFSFFEDRSFFFLEGDTTLYPVSRISEVRLVSAAEETESRSRSTF